MPSDVTTVESREGQFRATCTCGYKGVLTSRELAETDKEWHERMQH
jgi:hypothetical protein